MVCIKCKRTFSSEKKLEKHDRWTHWVKDAGVNQLGGIFKHAKPLPEEVRQKIVHLDAQGVEPWQISRELKIDHKSIYKILKKYHQTGSIEPEIREFKGKVLTPLVIHAMHKYKSENPAMSARQIRNKLLYDNVCCEKNVPSIWSVHNTVRKYIFGKGYK